jgi:hypothetical protein
MVVGTCVCVGQLGAYIVAFIHGLGHRWIKCKNLTKCVVGFLLQEKNLSHTNIAAKLVAFGSNGVNVFQGVKLSVTKQIQKTCTPFNLGVHCVSHKTKLVMQTLSFFPIMHQVETLFQSLY